MKEALEREWLKYGFYTVISVSTIIFTACYIFNVVTDIPVHTLMAIKFTINGTYPAYTLWYKVLSLCADFSTNYIKVALVSIILLSALLCFKYYLNYMILKDNLIKKQDFIIKNKLLPLVSLALIFVMPLISFYTQDQYPDQIVVSNFHIYLGNIAPNQWHNSTLILAMPFNIILFYYATSKLYSNKLSVYFIIGFLVILSALCKPNFILAFAPSFCFFVFISNIQKQSLSVVIIKVFIIITAAVLTLFYQWYNTYFHNDLFPHQNATIFSPFLVWKTYSPNVLNSLLLSIAFPISVTVLYFNKIDNYLALAWLTFLTALSIFICLAEYPEYATGNYWWGAIAACYILFLFSAKVLINQPLNWKAVIPYILLLMHFCSGCILLLAFIFFQKSLLS